MKDSDINWSGCNVGCTVRGGGNVIYKSGGIIWIVAPSGSEAFPGGACTAWPMGYCSGDQGASPKAATRITGRDGWFIPDLGMLQTAYACRTYWDTYSSGLYWSSTEYTNSVFRAMVTTFANGTSYSSTKNSRRFQRPFRIICY
jgi:hypothetical protein